MTASCTGEYFVALIVIKKYKHTCEHAESLVCSCLEVTKIYALAYALFQLYACQSNCKFTYSVCSLFHSYYSYMLYNCSSVFLTKDVRLVYL